MIITHQRVTLQSRRISEKKISEFRTLSFHPNLRCKDLLILEKLQLYYKSTSLLTIDDPFNFDLLLQVKNLNALIFHNLIAISHSAFPIGTTPVDFMGLEDAAVVVRRVFSEPQNFRSKTVALTAGKMTTKDICDSLSFYFSPIRFTDRQVTGC